MHTRSHTNLTVWMPWVDTLSSVLWIQHQAFITSLLLKRIRRTTAFMTPVGLHEYNRMPQGLCNSPASFMRMMLSIFGDLNFSSMLCYLATYW